MDSYEATSLLFAKIKSVDPENASKIMGYLLIQDLGEKDLMRLAFSPDSLLLSVVLQAKSQLGLSSTNSSAPSSPSPLNPIARPSNSNPFSQSSPRIPNNGFDFNKNPSSPSSANCWSLQGFRNNPISPKPGPLLSYDNTLAGSSQMHPHLVGKNGGSDAGVGTELVDEHQLNQYRSLLCNNSDTHLHRRSYSASDVCFESEDEGFKPCLYFARGFCKNGSNCKFVHGGLADSADASGEAFPDHREEIMRLKAAQQQRFGASSQFMAAVSPSHYNKYMNFLFQQQNEPQRASAGALMMGEEFQKFGLYRNERNDFFSMAAAEKRNSASRQIYLTFPADSTFKDEDVSEYFSKFGPVQDVRIPYQQKRMFGFVTFVYPETVKLILAKGNPHFLCDSRVLVKPYKEKGKILEKRQSLQQQPQELGEFLQCLSPSGLDCRDPFDLNLGGKMLYDSQDMLLRRKLEEQSELQHAVKLQGSRLMNLHLPDLNNRLHHQHNSLSSGASLPTESHPYVNQTTIFPSECNSQQLPEGTGPGHSQMGLLLEVNPLVIQRHICSKSDARLKCDTLDINCNVEEVLPDSLFSSPKKPDSNQSSDLPETSAFSSAFQSDTPTSRHCDSDSNTAPL